MKASEVVAALNHIIGTEGDLDVTISCTKPVDCGVGEQNYFVSEPAFIEIDKYSDHKEISIRDWPY